VTAGRLPAALQDAGGAGTGWRSSAPLQAVGASALAALTGALLALVLANAGPLAAPALLALVAALGLMLRPKACVAVAVVSVALLESDEQGFLSVTETYYEQLPGGLFRVHELLLGIAVAGVLLERSRSRRRLEPPGALTLPLLLLVVAVAFGAVMGYAGGGDWVNLLDGVRNLLLLAVLPVLVVNVIDDERDLRRALGLAAGVVAVKVAFGGTGWLLGAGRVVEGTVLTYYAPLPNLLLLLFVLSAVAAAFGRVRLPAVVWLLAPLALAVLVLSFRRNFWIALALGLLLVVLVAIGARGRLLLIPAGVLVGVALWIGVSALSASHGESPLVERARSLAPSRLTVNAQDRYRIDEQRNVRAEIAAHPLTGLGLGVPWTARHPLASRFEGGQLYTHVTVTWYWLKLGLIGVIAYLWLMFAGVRTGLDLWWKAADPLVRAVGVGIAAGLLGLMVAETTGSFTGVESRLTLLLATVLGWLAAARRLTVESPANPA
jgi:hypothetical protein